MSAAEMLDTPLAERMYIDQGDTVRVRVESDEFYDDEPGPPKATDGVQTKHVPQRNPYSVTVRKDRLSRGPSLINCQCSISEQGLGPIAWWNGASAEPMDQS
jgi:DNA-directed RNA polymerase III subunit RPC8